MMAKPRSLLSRGNIRNISVANFGEMSFGDTQLVPCESVKNLGVVLDSSLSLISHILFFCVVGYPPNWGKRPRYIDR